MDIVYQIMMGVSLAACAGFRAWLPLLITGIMARTGHITLNESMQFLARNEMLIIFGIASVLEFCGDKFIVIDHFLDAVGTVARPIAGTLLLSSMLTKMDLSTTLVLGLIGGGGTSLILHAGKAVARAKATLLSPFHGGLANAALSIGEDFLSGLGSLMVFIWPALAFAFAMALLITAVLLIVVGYKAGRKLYSALSEEPVQIEPALQMPIGTSLPGTITVEPQ